MAKEKKDMALVVKALEGSLELDKTLPKMSEREVEKALNLELEANQRLYHVRRLHQRLSVLRKKREFKNILKQIGHVE